MESVVATVKHVAKAWVFCEGCDDNSGGGRKWSFSSGRRRKKSHYFGDSVSFAGETCAGDLQFSFFGVASGVS